MSKYKYSYLQQQILNSLQVDKDNPRFIISLYDATVHNYQIDLSQDNEGQEMIQNIKRAILLFVNTVVSNPNFDTTNLEANLNKNIVIGVEMEDGDSHAGTTTYDESKNLFGIFADHNLVETGVIYHELFHLASRPKTKHTFSRGLKEGYTEALAHRYFQKGKVSYHDDVRYALELEKIVGRSTMEEAYSKGDVSIIKTALGIEGDNPDFNKFCQSLDLLLGSYYRTNSGNALPDEERRVERAKEVADAYLSNLSNKINYNNGETLQQRK